MLVPHCYAQRMAEDIEGSIFEMIAGCGHSPLDEPPERVLPRVIEFLLRGKGGR